MARSPKKSPAKKSPASSAKLVVVRNPYRATRAKDSRTYQAFAQAFAGYQFGAEVSQEDFECLLRKYGTSTAWVYIAVNRIANSEAQVRFQLIRREQRGQPNSIVMGPAAGLRDLLLYPNPYQSWFDLMESIGVSLELTGNAFIEKAALDRLNRPHELYVLNPSRMLIIPGPKGVQGYVYTANGKSIKFNRDEIIHIKYAHPYNDWYGLSPLTAARLQIDVDKAALEWNRNFLAKGAWPAGAITTPNDLDDPTRQRLETEIRRIVNRGKESVGQVLLLTGGLKWEKISLSPKEVDWLSARHMSRDEILAIYGVPFAVAGLYSTEQTTARSAGVNQQVVNFYQFTIFPKLEKIYAALNRELTPLFPSQLELIPDLRSVPALKDDVAKELVRAQTFRTLVASGWSIQMALGELYPHVTPPAWGTVAWMNQAMVPISEGVNPFATPAAQTPTTPGNDVPTDPSASTPAPAGGKAQRENPLAQFFSEAELALLELARSQADPL
jgi:HK97 family phage portal protein